MMHIRRLVFSLALALAGCGWGGPPQPLFSISGRVFDDLNQPVPGAVITDGQASTLSDDNGRYTLAVFATALSVIKPGRQPAHFDIAKGDVPVTHLAPAPGSVRVALDTRWGAPGLAGLHAAIATAADRLLDYPGPHLSDVDVLVMVTPGYIPDPELDTLRRWLHGGGRLILCGEWGGYPAQDLDVLNDLAQPAGITFTGATVKEPGATPDAENWDSVSAIAPPSLAKLANVDGADNQVYLFSTSALAIATPARPVLQSDRRAYAVLGLSGGRTGPQVLAAVGATGSGKVFALADSSLWKDDDSAAAGTPNIQRGANGRLVGAMLKW